MRPIRRAWSALMSRRLPWPRLQFTVSIQEDRIAATATRGGAILWHGEGPRANAQDDHTEAIALLLQNMPRARGSRLRPELVVEVGPEVVQVKRLFGLPAGADLRAASVIVRESATRFFRATSAQLVTSTVREHRDGSRWAAAYRGDIIFGIARACERARIKLRAIVPQDALTATLGRQAGRSLCAPLGHDGGAALSPSERRWLSLAGLVGVALLVTAPIAAARHAARAAADAHALIETDEMVALRKTEDLRRVSDLLTDLSGRRAERRSTIELLGALTTVLPEGAALTHLRVDTAGGALVVLAPSTDAVLAGLGGMTSVAGLELVGPVTKERVGGRDLERLNVRFRHAPSGTRVTAK